MSESKTSGILLKTIVVFSVLEVFAAKPLSLLWEGCPEEEEIFPCSYHYNSCAIVECIGPNVTQEVLNRVMSTIMRTHVVTHKFIMQNTELKYLDLAPFANGHQFNILEFENNSLLSEILVPQRSPVGYKIKTIAMSWNYNNLQNEGLRSMLKFLQPGYTSNLFLSGNKLTGTLGQQFLPYLSKFRNVKRLHLNDNHIRVLGGRQFRGMRDLMESRLENNELSEIAEGAFELDIVGNYPEETSVLNIYLGYNNLTDGCFHPSSGIARNRTIALKLNNNRFQRVRAEEFQKFLEVDPFNSLDFEGNPILCDHGMVWLKERRQDFEQRVIGLNCVNDPGETAFTSSLVEERTIKCRRSLN